MARKRPSRTPKKTIADGLVPVDRIDRSILLIRGQKVLLDSHLAEFYGVSVGRLNEAVKRNIERFPADFLFELNQAEWGNLKSQFAISSPAWGGRRTPPYAFTEQGVAMLSGVLHSARAIAVNVEIMRAFVRLRQILATHKVLARKIEELERRFTHKTTEHAEHIRRIYAILEALMNPPEPKREPIGFETEKDK